jgi:hypothetical protein
MANFKQSERAQGLFLTVNLEEQLIPRTGKLKEQAKKI